MLCESVDNPIIIDTMMITRPFVVSLVTLLIAQHISVSNALRTQLRVIPSDAELRHLFSNDSRRGTVRDRFDPQVGRLLHSLLKPRAVGSDALQEVQTFVSDFFHQLGGQWTVEKDSFQDRTPLGTKSFTNIIATWDKFAPKFLTLACHLDSKVGDGKITDEFVGATDSAGPCAVLLDLAEAVTPLLNQGIPPLISLQIIFFDGEEAFFEWKDPDNTYGSRHLSDLWLKSTAGPFRPNEPPLFPAKNRLEQMDVLVLLDLLGSLNPWPSIPSYYVDTLPLHQLASNVESKLLSLGLLSSQRKNSPTSYFASTSHSAFISDDQLPFVAKGIPCLHIIPATFPDVWHTMNDNGTAIVPESLEDFSKILQIFTLKYLEAL